MLDAFGDIFTPQAIFWAALIMLIYETGKLVVIELYRGAGRAIIAAVQARKDAALIARHEWWARLESQTRTTIVINLRSVQESDLYVRSMTISHTHPNFKRLKALFSTGKTVRLKFGIYEQPSETEEQPMSYLRLEDAYPFAT